MKALAFAVAVIVAICGYSVWSFDEIIIVNPNTGTAFGVENWHNDEETTILNSCLFDMVGCKEITAEVQPADNMDVRPNSSAYHIYAIAEFTAYSPSIDETDGSPFITANGTDKRIYTGCILAHKTLPFGTEVYIPYLDTVCTVHDRMPRKSRAEFDIFMDSKDEAFQFGRRTIEYAILQ